jgi:hypothetical protein
MARVFRLAVFAAVIAAAVLPETGCGSKSDTTTNPDMGTPNIPPGRKAGDSGGPGAPGGPKK